MKTCVRYEQTQCCVTGGEESFCSLFFVSGACPELLPKGIKTKEKQTVFEPFNLRIYFEIFNKKSNNKNYIKFLLKKAIALSVNNLFINFSGVYPNHKLVW